MLRDLVVQNRSYRGFDESRSVTREELLEFVDLTRYTASTVNIQPLKYCVVSDREQVETLVSMTGWAGKLPQLKLPKPGMYPAGFILICHDLRIHPNAASFLKDVGVAAQTILLAAAERGLGGCMIGSFNARQIQREFGLADELEPQLAIAIGKPAETVRLTEVGEDGNTAYYRDENGTHFVPKRSLEDILL